MLQQADLDDGQAIMEEMVGDNSLDDPNYILQGLTYISSVRPDEKPIYDKAKEAHTVVQSQVRAGEATSSRCMRLVSVTRCVRWTGGARRRRGPQVSYLAACRLPSDGTSRRGGSRWWNLPSQLSPTRTRATITCWSPFRSGVEYVESVE